MATTDGDDGSDPPLAADELFGILGNETRMRILQTLWEAFAFEDYVVREQEPTSFSELRARTEVEDSGNFDYHLGKPVGSLVEHREEVRPDAAGVQPHACDHDVRDLRVPDGRVGRAGGAVSVLRGVARSVVRARTGPRPLSAVQRPRGRQRQLRPLPGDRRCGAGPPDDAGRVHAPVDGPGPDLDVRVLWPVPQSDRDGCPDLRRPLARRRWHV